MRRRLAKQIKRRNFISFWVRPLEWQVPQNVLWFVGKWMAMWGWRQMVFRGVQGGHGKQELQGGNVVGICRCSEYGSCKYMAYQRWQKVSNIWIRGGCRTVVDYMLIRQDDRKIVRNVGVICGECCLPQHNLLLCALAWRDEVDRKEEVFVSQTSMETEKGRSSWSNAEWSACWMGEERGERSRYSMK